MSTSLAADQLSTTIDAVRTNLSQPDATTVVTFVADSALVDGYQTSINIRDFALSADEPPSIGGTDTGPTPVEYVLAALGTCQEIVYATYARVLGIPVDGVKVHAEGRLDLRGFYGVADLPAGFQDVSFAVEIDSPASGDEIARLIDTVNAHCPVLDILRQPVAVSGTYSHNGVQVAEATPLA